MGRLVDENGYLIDEYDMLTGEDLENYYPHDSAEILGLGKTPTYSWVIEKTLKDGTSSFEFPTNLTEQQAKDHADAILGSTPGVDTVSIFRKIGTVKRLTTTVWES